MVKKIIAIPNPILRQKSKPVAKVDKKILNLIKDLNDTLKAAEKPRGIGLSAPQIGVSKQVFIITLGKKIMTVINPEITSCSKETLFKKLKKEKHFMEGCLSVPSFWGAVDRPWKIRVSFLDINGNRQEKEFVGKNASLFQHEYDHLRGILFIDRILKQKGKLYKMEKNEKGEDEFVEIKLI